MAAVSEQQAELLTLVTQCLERAALLGNSEFQGDKLKQRWAHNKATPFAWQKEAQRWIQSTQERYSSFLGPKGANGASRNPGLSWNPLNPASMESPNDTLLKEFCAFWKQALYFKPAAAKWFRGASREEREEARAMLFTDMPFKNVPDSVHPLCLIYYARAADSSGLEDALLSVFLEEESKLSDDGETMSQPKKHPLTPMLRALLAFFALDYQGIVPEGNVDDEVHDRDPVDALRTALLTHYATADFNPLTYNEYGIDPSNELERLPHLDFLTIPLPEHTVKLIMLLYERGGGSEEYPFAELPTLRDTNPELYTHIVDTMRRGADSTVPRLDFTLASAAVRAQHNQGGTFSEAQQMVAFRKCRELPSKKLQDAGLLCSEMSLFFRLDDFDNVICAVGSATSSTAYECLHRLPYARGGFSSDANCLPLHWQAASKLLIEYPDAIPQLLDRLPFTFMSVDAFLGRLWRYGLAAVVGGTVAEDLDSEAYRAKFTKWTEERCLAFERLEKYIEYQRAQRLVKAMKPDQKPTLDFNTGGASKLLMEDDQDEPSGNVSPDPDTTSAFSVNISSYSELQAASFIETQMSALEQGSSSINGRGLSPRPGSGSANNTVSPRDLNKMRLRELRQKRVALKNRGTGGSNLSRTSTLSQPYS